MCGQTKMNLTGCNATWIGRLLHCLSCLCLYSFLSVFILVLASLCVALTQTVETGFKWSTWRAFTLIPCVVWFVAIKLATTFSKLLLIICGLKSSENKRPILMQMAIGIQMVKQEPHEAEMCC